MNPVPRVLTVDDTLGQPPDSRDEYAALRDALARHRDEIAQLRDEAARLRDEVALERAQRAEQGLSGGVVDLTTPDGAAARRDQAAANRDRAADARDRVADATDASDAHQVPDASRAPGTSDASGGAAPTQVPDPARAAAARRAAARDRVSAAADRLAAEKERSFARADRDRSAGDRDASAGERVEAAADRSYSLADRTASATERSAASFDTVTAELWRAAIAQAPLGVMEFDDEGVIRSANPALHRLLDYPDGQLEGISYVSSVVHPEQRAESAEALRGHVTRGAGSHAEVQRHLVTSTGADRWVHGTGVRVRGVDGQPDRMIGFLIDATAARLDRQRLAQANARLEKLLQFSTDAILVLNAGVVLSASPGLAGVTGNTAAAAVGSSVRSLFHPDDAPVVEDLLAQITTGPASVIGFSARIAHVDGRWRHVEGTASDRTRDPAIGGVLLNMRDVTDRVDMVQRLAHQATHDDLTGLANRALLIELLQQALARAHRSGTPCAVLFLDLDDFKDANDTFGHAAGDAVLRATAERLRALVRPGDTAGRLGGDEFVVVAEDVDDPGVAIGLADRLRTGLARPVTLPGGGTVAVTCSIGIARSTSLTSDELLREADKALYRAKALGRDRSES